MKIAWDVFAGVMISLGFYGVIVYRLYRGNKEERQEKSFFSSLPKDLKKLAKILSNQKEPPLDLVEKNSERAETRYKAFIFLSSKNKAHLFPKKYLGEKEKAEGFLYSYLEGEKYPNFPIEVIFKEKIQKKIITKGEEIEVSYLGGIFKGQEDDEQVFAIGPCLSGLYDFPMMIFTSLELEYKPEIIKIIDMAHQRFLLIKN